MHVCNQNILAFGCDQSWLESEEFLRDSFNGQLFIFHHNNNTLEIFIRCNVFENV